MKFNQWTLGLAALGVVSLASAARAEEKMNPIQAALSSTTISGYVDTSAMWNPGNGNAALAPVAFNGPGKADGFNLNVVQLTIAKALDEGEWASGYRADLWFGPDANSLGSQSVFANGSRASAGDFAIRQAYVALRTPVGNGIEWKMGVFDTVLGYETLESGNNPNITHSYGFTVEPTTHTGVLATYRINDAISVSAGVANTFGASINERSHGPNSAATPSPVTAESYKTYMGSIALTAPSDWGWAAGSTLYAGVVNGFSSTAVDVQTSLYIGGTLATPVTGLKVGAAFDWVQEEHFANNSDSLFTVGLYASYQASEKLSFHGRGEFLSGELPGENVEVYALTGTVQYDLWANVISRLEVRWDVSDGGPGNGHFFGGSTGSGYNGDFTDYHAATGVTTPEKGVTAAGDYNYNDASSAVGDIFAGTGISGAGGNQKNAVLVALQLIYKF